MLTSGRGFRRLFGGLCSIALLGVIAAQALRVGAQQGAGPPAEPGVPGHCACSGTLCPVDASGRGCSCGCALAGDAQPAQVLSADAALCENGTAGAFPCHDIDLLAYLPLADIGGGMGNDVWGWTDPLTGREYALVGRSNGTAFIDVSNPGQPVYLGNLPTQTFDSTWRDIKVFADHAFVVSEAANHGLQVFDLTQLRAVSAPPLEFVPTAHYAGFGSAHNLAIDTGTGFAYAVGTRTCGGGLHIVDVRAPAAPATAGCYSLDGYTHDVQCVVSRGPDDRYRGRELCFASNEDTLTIVDVSDKHDAREVSRTGYDASAYTHQGWLTSDHRYFLVDDEGDERAFGRPTRTFVWDLANLEAPGITQVYEGRVAAIDHNLFVRGHLVYEANYRSGLRLLDARDLAGGAPLREVGFFDLYPDDDLPAFNGAWSVYPYFASGIVLLNGIEQGLFVLRPRVSPEGERPGLSVSMAPVPEPAVPDRDLIYQVITVNGGPGAATRVQTTVQVPLDVTIVSARSSIGTCLVTGIVTCEAERLAPGTSIQTTVVVRSAQVRDLAFTARVTADGGRGDADGTSATLTTGMRAPARAIAYKGPGPQAAWQVGRTATVQWVLRGIDGGVRVELSRDGGVTWETLADDAPNTGFFDWIATGPATSQARVRVSGTADPALSAAGPGDFSIR